MWDEFETYNKREPPLWIRLDSIITIYPSLAKEWSLITLVSGEEIRVKCGANDLRQRVTQATLKLYGHHPTYEARRD